MTDFYKKLDDIIEGYIKKYDKQQEWIQDRILDYFKTEYDLDLPLECIRFNKGYPARVYISFEGYHQIEGEFVQVATSPNRLEPSRWFVNGNASYEVSSFERALYKAKIGRLNND